MHQENKIAPNIMARIAYFENELAKCKGYEYDMALLAMMSNEEKATVFGWDDLNELPQLIADYYGIMA